MEDMGVRDLLDFQTVRKSENSQEEGFVRFYRKYVFYSSVFCLRGQEIYKSGNPMRAEEAFSLAVTPGIQRALRIFREGQESLSCNTGQVMRFRLRHGAPHSPVGTRRDGF